MIETQLLIVITCDNCDAQDESEPGLDGATRPDIGIFEGRAWSECVDDGWSRFAGHELCPDCTKIEEEAK